MNKFEVKKVISYFGYEHFGLFIDDISIDMYLYKLTSDKEIRGLEPAWFNELESLGEQDYLKEILLSEIEEWTNIPILVCCDDLDFSCIVVVAKIRYTNDSVIWDKIGHVMKKNWDNSIWCKSGIQMIENWTDEQWEKYNGNFDLLDLNDPAWNEWISENWRTEELNRTKNYTHFYFNNDENIEWFKNIPKLVFDKKHYIKCIHEYLHKIQNNNNH